MDVIGKIWNLECHGNPMWVLHQKLKTTANLLSIWSKKTYGDIYEVPKRLEQEISNLEIYMQDNNSPSTREKLYKTKADYTFYLKTQESILRQKARVKWLVDGDGNTSYFHKTIKDRKRRIGINKIMNEEQEWVEGNVKAAEAGVKYFKRIFGQTPNYNDFQDLEHINITIADEINQELIELPTEEEIRNNLMTMEPDSAPGPDRFTAKFFQTCWGVVAPEVTKALHPFFCGANLPKWLTHTNIAMIPKVDHPQQFFDPRPISLCNVISKIFSKVLNSRLSKLLPSLISKNQSGFIKGRSITENILLAHEIIQDIASSNGDGNVVLKLDMTQAFDRVSWPFLCILMRKMGFCEIWIDMLYRHIFSNWYSFLVNGNRHEFFNLKEA